MLHEDLSGTFGKKIWKSGMRVLLYNTLEYIIIMKHFSGVVVSSMFTSMLTCDFHLTAVTIPRRGWGQEGCRHEAFITRHSFTRHINS